MLINKNFNIYTVNLQILTEKEAETQTLSQRCR